MLMDFIATAAVGVAFASFGIVLRHLTRKRAPRWITPALAGGAMLIFSIWNEYTWFERAAGALPAEVIVVSAPTERSAIRPWTYLAPLTTRFIALDRTGMAHAEGNPALRVATALIVQRWANTRGVRMAFDCDSARRADLVEGAAMQKDGTLTGAEWIEVDPGDGMLKAACMEV